MDYNPYNRNEIINNNDSSQLRQEKINQTKNWVFGNSMRDSLSKNGNISNYNSYNQNNINPVENRKDNNILIFYLCISFKLYKYFHLTAQTNFPKIILYQIISVT